MGIFKAASAAVRGTLADQWLEAFSCDALSADTLVQRGRKMTSDRSSNTEGSDDVISAGSVILVPDGAAAVVTEMGKVIACYETSGEHKFTGEKARGVFGGGVSSALRDVGSRIAYGGDVPIVQRVYFINTKECPDNPFCLVNVPLRLRDENTGLDLDACVSVEGVYSYRVCDPVTFYKHVSGNVHRAYTRRELQSQLDAEVSTAILTALCETVESVRPSELPQYTETLCARIQSVLRGKWAPTRGIEPYSAAISSLTVGAADMDTFRMIQRAKVLTDPAMAAATLVGAQAGAMTAAAQNPAGSMLGAALLAAQTRPKLWGCVCGATNTGNFCENCGRPR
ncbi:MAG: SPFH domain-containing protein [Clostridia bacterium]|nr:SPFH domain-containing protein [Clostridia bacterium]